VSTPQHPHQPQQQQQPYGQPFPNLNNVTNFVNNPVAQYALNNYSQQFGKNVKR
jgi:hypothetical protein